MTTSPRPLGVLHNAVFVSIIVFLFGVIFLLVSHELLQSEYAAVVLSEILRDFGTVLCSIGLISVLYEMLIRRQLIADYNNTLQEILDPDTRKLGIRALFRDRDDKAARGRSLDALLRATRTEMFCTGLGFYQFLPEKREAILAKVREGCSFRFLIFDPDSDHAEALDKSLGYGTGSLTTFLAAQRNYFIEFLKVLDAQMLRDRVRVRMYQSVPTFGALMIDPSSTDRRLEVELYGFGVEGTVCPGMELVPQEGDWYSFYERQMEALWQAGRPLEAPLSSARPAPSASIPTT